MLRLFLSFVIARAVPIPWLERPNANPLAAIFLILNKSNKNEPNAAPTIPVIIVSIAVRDGSPPITSEMPMAIGAVTLLGSNDFDIMGSSCTNTEITTVITMANIDPSNIDAIIASRFAAMSLQFK